MAIPLRHLRSDVPNKRPDPAAMLDGQLAMNQALESPGLYFRGVSDQLLKAGPTHIAPEPPNVNAVGAPNLCLGESWLDTSQAPPVLNFWGGSSWIPLQAGSAGGGVAVGPTPPATGKAGDLWFRSDIGQLFVLYGESPSQCWVQAVTGVGIGGGAALEFPPYPDVDQVYFHIPSQNSWLWDGVAWVDKAGEERFSTILTKNLDLYVSTTGSDTLGDGTTGNPFASPHRAMEVLRDYIIPSGVLATVNILNGDYQFTTTLNLDHPWGAQIKIAGQSVTPPRPLSSQLLGDGSYDDTPASAAANEIVLRNYFQTRLYFKDCLGMSLKVGTGITLDKLLIARDAAGNRYTDGLNVGPIAGINISNNCAFHYWYTGIRASGGLSGSGFVTNASTGVYWDGDLRSVSHTVTCSRIGFYAQRGDCLMDAVVEKCQVGSYVLTGASVSGRIESRSCRDLVMTTAGSNSCIVAFSGIDHNDIVEVTGGTFTGGVNSPYGSVINGTGLIIKGGTVSLASCNLASSGATGAFAVRITGGAVVSLISANIDAFNGGAIDATDCSLLIDGQIIKNVGTYLKAVRSRIHVPQYSGFLSCTGPVGITVSRGSFLDMSGGAGTITTSPPVNTAGNGQSYILA